MSAKLSLSRPHRLDSAGNVYNGVTTFSVDEYAEEWEVPPPRADRRCFIFGVTPVPRSTFHIYPGRPWDAPVARRTGVDEPTRLPDNPRSWCRCGACRGHRAGVKGWTLRDHRRAAGLGLVREG
jgi:hypothetical protein